MVVVNILQEYTEILCAQCVEQTLFSFLHLNQLEEELRNMVTNKAKETEKDSERNHL